MLRLRGVRSGLWVSVLVNLVLACLFGCVLVLTGGYMHSRIVYWRGSFEALDDNYREVTEMLLSSEREKIKSDGEAAFLRNVLIGFAQNQERQIMLSDQQLTAIAQLVAANLTPPKDMN